MAKHSDLEHLPNSVLGVLLGRALTVLREDYRRDMERRRNTPGSLAHERLSAIRDAERIVGRPDDGLPDWVNKSIDQGYAA